LAGKGSHPSTSRQVTQKNSKTSVVVSWLSMKPTVFGTPFNALLALHILAFDVGI
jgi:hypothetical protein